MRRQFLVTLGVIAMELGCQGIGLAAIKCPEAPEQISKDYDADISGAVAKFRRFSGIELKAQAAGIAKDLLGKLPGADRVYVEQMMYAAFCSSLNEDKTLSDSEKRKELREYNSDVRKAMEQQASREKQPEKKKASGLQSKVNPPVTPLTQAETKQPETQKSQPAVSQSPSISQHSEGANSPNVVGNQNVVIVTPPSEAKVDEVIDILRQKGDAYNPVRLLKKYPLGYAIFEINYQNTVIPQESLSKFREYEVDWTVVKVIQNTKDQIALRLPDLKRKDGTAGITNVKTGGRKKVGNLGCGIIGTETETLGLCGEILAIREDGIVFLVNLIQLPPLPKKVS